MVPDLPAVEDEHPQDQTSTTQNPPANSMAGEELWGNLRAEMTTCFSFPAIVTLQFAKEVKSIGALERVYFH
jgi:hypothetical protein